MHYDDLRALYWVATLGSATKAANQLRVTQACISQRLSALRRDLGGQELLTQKPFALTAFARGLLPYVTALLESEGQLRAACQPRALRPLPLRIGVIESVLHSSLREWIVPLQNEVADISLALTVDTTAALDKLMRDGCLDLVVSAEAISGVGVETQLLALLPMTFAGRADLYERRRYSLAELSRQGLITFQSGSQPARKLSRALGPHGVSNARVHTISSIACMVELVLAGCGAATLPVVVLERYAAAHPNLRALDCAYEPAALPLHISWRPDPSDPRHATNLAHAISLMTSASAPNDGS